MRSIHILFLPLSSDLKWNASGCWENITASEFILRVSGSGRPEKTRHYEA